LVSDLIMKLPYNNKQAFPPILPDHDEWPVVKLSKHREEFVELVTRQAVARIKTLRPGTAELIKELEATRYKEKLRLQNEPWEVDPDDEVAFWKKVKADLMEISGKKETGGREDELQQPRLHPDRVGDTRARFAAFHLRSRSQLVQPQAVCLLYGQRRCL